MVINRYQKGFTIVELLIVIVIIGILAALIIVSYNGIQQRAKNNQTVAAVGSWVKALKMHYIETGSWLNIKDLSRRNNYLSWE